MPRIGEFQYQFQRFLTVTVQVEKGSAKVSVQQILLEMRKYRSGLIQTRDQLRFAYRAIIQGAKNFLPCEDVDNSDETNERECLLKNSETLSRTQEEIRSELDPSSQPAPPGSFSASNNNLTPATELRQRVREEKNRKMKEKIQNMKEKQKKSESRLRTKKLLFKVGIFSLGILATASLVYYYWPSSVTLSDRTGTRFEQNFDHMIGNNFSLSEPSVSRANGS